jgi:hypothetical protein
MDFRQCDSKLVETLHIDKLLVNARLAFVSRSLLHSLTPAVAGTFDHKNVSFCDSGVQQLGQTKIYIYS